MLKDTTLKLSNQFKFQRNLIHKNEFREKFETLNLVFVFCFDGLMGVRILAHPLIDFCPFLPNLLSQSISIQISADWNKLLCTAEKRLFQADPTPRNCLVSLSLSHFSSSSSSSLQSHLHFSVFFPRLQCWVSAPTSAFAPFSPDSPWPAITPLILDPPPLPGSPPLRSTSPRFHRAPMPDALAAATRSSFPATLLVLDPGALMMIPIKIISKLRFSFQVF